MYACSHERVHVSVVYRLRHYSGSLWLSLPRAGPCLRLPWFPLALIKAVGILFFTLVLSRALQRNRMYRMDVHSRIPNK